MSRPWATRSCRGIVSCAGARLRSRSASTRGGINAGASCICLLFASPIIRFFRNDPEVIAVGTVALRAQAVSLPLMATIVITNMMLQACGKGVKASIASAARNGIFFIPLILILPRLFGLFGVEISQACADILSFILAIPFAVSELKKM